MTNLLLGVGMWLGISLVAVAMFALGAALGRRGAWEQGYQAGRSATPVKLHRHVPAGLFRRPVA